MSCKKLFLKAFPFLTSASNFFNLKSILYLHQVRYLTAGFLNLKKIFAPIGQMGESILKQGSGGLSSQPMSSGANK